MNKYEFNEEEKRLFLRMLNYFIGSAKKEIEELKLLGGNKNYIPKCEKELSTLKSIKRKVAKAFNFVLD